MTKDQYENMTLAKIKEIAKTLDIKNISKYKKMELIDEIIKTEKQNDLHQKNNIHKENDENLVNKNNKIHY